MKNTLLLVALLAQLIFAFFSVIWILAFLGFTDETKRSVPVSLFGKFLAGLCVLLAVTPVGIIVWVAWCYYFSPTLWSRVPLGFFLPLVAILTSLLLCAGLIYLFKIAGYRQKK